jgi:hypothetical protein
MGLSSFKQGFIKTKNIPDDPGIVNFFPPDRSEVQEYSMLAVACHVVI